MEKFKEKYLMQILLVLQVSLNKKLATEEQEKEKGATDVKTATPQSANISSKVQSPGHSGSKSKHDPG